MGSGSCVTYQKKKRIFCALPDAQSDCSWASLQSTSWTKPRKKFNIMKFHFKKLRTFGTQHFYMKWNARVSFGNLKI